MSDERDNRNQNNENAAEESVHTEQTYEAPADSSVNAGTSGNNSANAYHPETGSGNGQGMGSTYGQPAGSQNSGSQSGAWQNNGGYQNNGSYQNYGGNQNQGTYQNNGAWQNNGNGQNQNGGQGYSNPYSSAYGSNPTPNYGAAGGNDRGGRRHKNHENGQNGKKRGGVGRTILAIALCAAVGVGAGFATYGVRNAVESSSEGTSDSATLQKAENGDAGSTSGQNDQSAAESSSSAQTGSGTEKSSSGSNATLQTADDNAATVTDVSNMVSEVMPSIVAVYNKFTETGNFFGQEYSQQEEAAGSGIIISKTDDELLVVTNNHVVADTDELSVQFIDDKTATANLKGTDSSNDLAVIAVKLSDISDDTMSKIKVATLGDSDDLKVGEPAIAIGNALGYGQSVTTGVISALNREVTDSNGNTNTFIQTDAAINPGNSGGALLNSKGEVIGINSSKIGATEVEGIGYAIPISRAIPIIENLMNQETKTKVDADKQGYLGIRGVSVTQQIANAYDMPQGVYVAEIIDGGGAADSDLQKGDIITAIDGSTISSMDELQKQLTYYQAGTEVSLTVQRAAGNGSYKEQTVKVKLGTKATIENDSNGNTEDGSSSGSGSGSGRGSAVTPQMGGNSDGGSTINPFEYFFGNSGN